MRQRPLDYHPPWFGWSNISPTAEFDPWGGQQMPPDRSVPCPNVDDRPDLVPTMTLDIGGHVHPDSG